MGQPLHDRDPWQKLPAAFYRNLLKKEPLLRPDQVLQHRQAIRGEERSEDGLFSYISLEQRGMANTGLNFMIRKDILLLPQLLKRDGMIFLFACQGLLALLILSGMVYNHIWSAAIFYALRTVVVFALAWGARSSATGDQHGPTKGAMPVLVAGLLSDCALIFFDAQIKTH